MNAVKELSVQTEENAKAIEMLKAREEEIATLKAALKQEREKAKSITFKVKEFKHNKTGEDQAGIEIHGITPKPMFLYGSQALKLIEVSAQLNEFVEANRANLTWKK